VPPLASRGELAHRGDDYTLRMLYFECEGQMFYAGQEDLESRHEARRLLIEV
jgi:hypothetical protein